MPRNACASKHGRGGAHACNCLQARCVRTARTSSERLTARPHVTRPAPCARGSARVKESGRKQRTAQAPIPDFLHLVLQRVRQDLHHARLRQLLGNERRVAHQQAQHLQHSMRTRCEQRGARTCAVAHADGSRLGGTARALSAECSCHMVRVHTHISPHLPSCTCALPHAWQGLAGPGLATPAPKTPPGHDFVCIIPSSAARAAEHSRMRGGCGGWARARCAACG